MAAKTPDSLSQDLLGTLRLVRALFTSTNLDNTDTYATGMKGIVDAWFKPNTTTGVVGCDIDQSTGTITFATSADNQTGTLFILARN